MTALDVAELADLWLSDSIPSRTLLVNSEAAEGEDCILMHFDDIRDAIELVIGRMRFKHFADDKHNSNMISVRALISAAKPHWTPAPQTASLPQDTFEMLRSPHTKEPVLFACTPLSKTLLCSEDGGMRSAAVVVTLEHLGTDTEPIAFENIDPYIEAVRELLEKFGPLLAVSQVKRNSTTRRVFKFFAEYYRVQDAAAVLDGWRPESLIKALQQGSFGLTIDGVDLHNADREALFFIPEHESVSVSVSVSTPTATPLASPLPATAHRRSISHSSDDFTIGTPTEGESYEIDLWKIEANLDLRTTCMIRNIPNKYTQQMVIDMVNETHRGCYDFLYLRMDFRNRCNVGYAFINFTDPKHIVCFAKRVCGKRWARFNSDKVCNLTFARIQGLTALVDKFRHSKVMFEPPAYRPKLFYTNGPLAGQDAPFPL